MPNIVDVTYAQTGESTKTNQMGMREMQERAYSARNAQYLLLKAPPASGKSRALMFIALDKLHNQGIKKAIVAVPERSIGGSFGTTDLTNQPGYRKLYRRLLQSAPQAFGNWLSVANQIRG